MSLIVTPKFKFQPRLSAVVTGDPAEISLRPLRDAVLGKGEPGLSRVHAVVLLESSDYPNRHRDIEAVLENSSEPSRLRVQAARSLGRIGNRACQEALVRNIGAPDPSVRAAVLTALGRVGDRQALDAVVQALPNAEGRVLSQGRFAASLIAYRHRLDGHDWPLPADLVEPPREDSARPLQIRRALESEAELAIRMLTHAPLGIEYSDPHVLNIRCGPNRWLLLVNREFTQPGSTASLGRKKGLLGVVASRQQETHRYSLRYLVLISPAADAARLSVVLCRPFGDAAFAGEAALRDGRIDFKLLAVRQPGAAALHFEGRFGDGELKVKTALSGPVVAPRRPPMIGS